jgi:amylosucrase
VTGGSDLGRWPAAVGPPAEQPTLPIPDDTAARARAMRVAGEELADVDPLERELFLLRLERYWEDLWSALQAPYGTRRDLGDWIERLVKVMAARYRQRSSELRRLDEERVLRPDWFQQPDMIGYVAYVDRFAGTLRGIPDRLDYLDELRVRYLHLMPLLQTRDGEDDGGYAVSDYRAVDRALGTMDDLEEVCRQSRDHGISVCIDLVINHCAAEHEWARRAAAGDLDASAMFWIFPDRAMPDAYEATLPEVFPESAPGSFTQLADGRWVWTTFHDYQWDLNWSNPRVLVEMTDILLELANRGVEVFRLDAVAFLWKRLGTVCQNQPEVHDLLQLLRASARIAAPAVAFKAEAIVSPDELSAYLGVGRHHGRVSDLAYQNSLMVQFWSAIATRDARLITTAMRRLPAKPAATAWATYIRCHDDIGWAITDEDASVMGWDGRSHRAFLSEFYVGSFPGSFARGETFQHNVTTGDRRVSGTTASLAGLDDADERGDPIARDLAIGRILAGHALIFASDGIPLIYMGDEIGMRNDDSYRADPALARDSRWVHRPFMDWEAAARRVDPGSVEGRVFDGLRHLASVRAATPQLHAATPLEVIDSGVVGVYAVRRPHPVGPLVALFELGGRPEAIEGDVLTEAGIGRWLDLLSGESGEAGRALALAPYQARWLVAMPAG